ncbi:hypothetical protein Lepto7376_2842 [[Leptolyngbya] sp. PCC 7376]|uniref:hypothetical protein n=1 Tax=[Leptolyngbya] sp. PCC 7376 TaxID=111781 RepID=UPI00029F4C83|nr:hypothetical protein [[Leptolyngbya] sp. PCC 7376]AFY39096.1 hypothetical protein Lepto7376_2842 [[Leptolyngbya] sp. PCC 7376]
MTRFPKISFAIGLSLAIASSLTLPSLAQTSDDDVYQDNENSTIFGGDDNFNPFDLIHNSRLNSGQSSEQFQAASDEKIDDAAANYRESLLQYFQQQKANSAPDAEVNSDNVEVDVDKP